MTTEKLEKVQSGFDHIKAAQMRLDSVVNVLLMPKVEIKREEMANDLTEAYAKLQLAVMDIQEAVND